MVNLKTSSIGQEKCFLYVAVICIAIFPTVGNAVAILTEISRRGWQIALLMVSLGTFAYSLVHLRMLHQLRDGAILRHAGISVSVALGLTAVTVASAFVHQEWPSAYAVAALLMTVVWLSVVLLNFLWPFIIHGHHSANPSDTEPMTSVLGCVIFVVAAGLTLVAYFAGPDPGQVYMAFRGSTIQAGLTGAILAGLSLALARGWFRLLLVVLAFYIGFVSTSRTAVLGVLTVSIALVVSEVVGDRAASVHATWKRTLQYAGLLALSVAVVVTPALAWTFYPYFSSRPSHVIIFTFPRGQVETFAESEIFFLRFGRWGRLARAIGGGTIGGGTIGGVTRQEGRIDLLVQSVKAVASRPFGWWPVPFDQVVPLECGVPGASSHLCGYPHNLVVEVGFHFGWMPALVLASGLLAWTIRVVRSLRAHNSLLTRISGLCFLGWLVFSQLSGNLLDHVPTLILGFVWMAAQTERTVELVAPKG